MSIEDIDKAMAEQGVDEYSRSLVTNQLKTTIGTRASVSTGEAQDGKKVGALKQNPRSRFIDRSIYVVAAIEPLGVLPQIYTIFSHRNASYVAIPTWALFVLFDIVWLLYGWESRQKSFIIFSALFTLLELLVVIGAVAYGALVASAEL